MQAYYTVGNTDDSPATVLRTVALVLRHYVRPLGRTALGGSSGLFGNGMAFRAKVLTDGGGRHLTEDMELRPQLLLYGTLVDFVLDATLRAEMPDTLHGSRTQHERWERGRQA